MSRVIDIPGWCGQLVGGFRELERGERNQFAHLWDDLLQRGVDPDDAERQVACAMIAVACVALSSGPYLFPCGFGDPGFHAAARLPIGTLPVDAVYLALGEDDELVAKLARIAVGRRD